MEYEKITSTQALWDRYLIGGAPVGASQEALRKARFINSFSIVGCTSLFVFGIVQFPESLFKSFFEITMGFIGIANLLVLRRNRNIEQASSVILGFMIVILIFLLTTGGVQNTGLFWIYTYPLLAFFLKGNIRGSAWMAGLMICYAIIITGANFGYWTIPYEIVLLRQVFLSFIAVSALAYFYQSINERQAIEIHEHVKNLVSINKQLHEELMSHAAKTGKSRKSPSGDPHTQRG